MEAETAGTQNGRVIHEFLYRPNRAVIGFVVVAVCAGAGLMAWMSQAVDEDVEVHGVTLTAEQIRTGAGILAIAGAVLVPLMLRMVVWAFGREPRVGFTADSVIVPEIGWSGGPTGRQIEIRFLEIGPVSVGPFVGNARVLRFTHGRRRIQLYSNMFPARADFDAVVSLLAAKGR